jgi:uncharacterized protein (TIGR02466 family)
MPGVREDWFPTSIWYFEVDDHERLNAEMLSVIATERDRDAQGVTDRSSVLGWHSATNFHQREEFKEIIDHVLRNAREVAEFGRWDFRRGDLAILNCWAIVNGKFASNAYHNHPNSLLSGAYYLQTNKESGAIVFRDPREGALMLPPPITEFTPWTFQTIRYQPSPGRMLIFPSWLYHTVEPNLSDQERVSLSFNIGYRLRG